jgi:hypothetical protein
MKSASAFIRHALVGAAVVFAGAALAQPKLPAAELFFHEPATSGAQLSPDGRYVAMKVAAKGHHARLAVLDLQTMKPDVVASFSETAVGQFRWVNDKRLVFNIENELVGPDMARHGPGLFAVDADGGQFRQLVETYLSVVKAPDSGVPLLPWRNHLLHSQAPRSDARRRWTTSCCAGSTPAPAVPPRWTRRCTPWTGRWTTWASCAWC